MLVCNIACTRSADSVMLKSSILGHFPVMGIGILSGILRQTFPAEEETIAEEALQIEFITSGEGDTDAVEDQLYRIAALPVLPITTEAEALAQAFIQGQAIPEAQPNDALNIALAAVHRVQYLVSWNFRHIVNASLRPAIERVCRAGGYDPPIICTPEELLEVNNG